MVISQFPFWFKKNFFLNIWTPRTRNSVSYSQTYQAGKAEKNKKAASNNPEEKPWKLIKKKKNFYLPLFSSSLFEETF